MGKDGRWEVSVPRQKTLVAGTSVLPMVNIPYGIWVKMGAGEASALRQNTLVAGTLVLPIVNIPYGIWVKKSQLKAGCGGFLGSEGWTIKL